MPTALPLLLAADAPQSSPWLEPPMLFMVLMVVCVIMIAVAAILEMLPEKAAETEADAGGEDTSALDKRAAKAAKLKAKAEEKAKKKAEKAAAKGAKGKKGKSKAAAAPAAVPEPAEEEPTADFSDLSESPGTETIDFSEEE